MLKSKEKVNTKEHDVSFEEITDLQDISIELIDDDMISTDPHDSYHDGVEYESITDIPLTERMTVEILDVDNHESNAVDTGIDDEIDVESLSAEIDTIDEINIEDLSAEEFSIDEILDEATAHQDSLKNRNELDDRREDSGDIKDGPLDTLDEILDIIDDESALSGVGVESGDNTGTAYREYKAKNTVSTEQGNYKKNRINAIEDSDDILDDEFVILQSDLAEGEELVLLDEETHEAEYYDNGDEIAASSNSIPEEATVKRREKKINEIIIDISEEEKEKFSKDFDIKTFKAFDLREAEKIAREDIVFLSEEDLVEELQDIDLVPIEDANDEVDIKIVTDDEEFQHNIDEIISEMEHEELNAGVRTKTTVVEYDDIDSSDREQQEESNPDDEIIDNEIIDDNGIDTGSIEETLVIDDENYEEIGNVGVDEIAVSSDLTDNEQREMKDEISESDITGSDMDNEYTIIEDVNQDNVQGEDAVSEHETELMVDKEIIDNAEKDSYPLPEEAALDEIEEVAVAVEKVPVMETIPVAYASLTGSENVYLIDDENVQTDEKKSENFIFEESELEKITANMVEVVEGDSRVLREANVEDDKDRIASIMSGSAPAFEDLLIDFADEYSFIDEKTDFVDDTFISAEYREFEKIKTVSHTKDAGSGDTVLAIEILGLSNYEIGSIEGAVFLKEFENIDLHALETSATPGYDAGIDDRELIARFDYIATGNIKLNTDEKKSIEEDIDGTSALIFEESIEDIQHKLSELDTERNKIIGEKLSDDGPLYDISDSVFILDSKEDVARFSELFPEDTRQQVKILLKYLDGLFEKLPEDVIKKFAESEYFTLYAQVFNELERK